MKAEERIGVTMCPFCGAPVPAGKYHYCRKEPQEPVKAETMKAEILEKKGITPERRFYKYGYLYKSILDAMQEYSDHSAKERYDEAYDYLGDNLDDNLLTNRAVKSITDALQIAAYGHKTEEK